MKNYIEKRVKEVAMFTIQTKKTVRDTAKFFNVSKSTVYRDLTERLPLVDIGLCCDVEEVLRFNDDAKRSRGGKNRWINREESINICN
ncbi:sporulation transcriptional regulator SpoIIID [Clostridium sp. LP20]|uniref:sporulation transcriptional regulator SpoIIID n=1 Tax=Clostridium sp. LP20 TaxID=3418665 RepID=UPI003EE797E2